jgi:transcriptional regulator with XRE-family HTH domain
MKELDYNEIAKKLAYRRKQLGYSYADLADVTGMSRSTLQRYETGAIKNIPITRLKALSAALDMDPNELIGIEEENSPAPVKSTREWLEDLLVSRGIIKPGEDLTDNQADMLIALVQLIEAWLKSMGE